MSYIKRELSRQVNLLSEDELINIQFIIQTELEHREKIEAEQKLKAEEEKKKVEEVINETHRMSRSEFNYYYFGLYKQK